MKLSAGVLILAVTFVTLTGPLQMLQELPEGALLNGGYWQDVAEATIRSAAQGGLSAIAFVAAALGLPILSRKRGDTPPNEGGSA